MNRNFARMNRRQFLGTGAALGAGLLTAGLPGTLLAQNRLGVTMADIGVGDPGDWSRLEGLINADINVVAIGNSPSAVVNQLVAGGGRRAFDVINIVGGMQQPLVDADLILPIEVDRLSHWDANHYIADFLAPGTPGFDFIGYQDTVYGVPTVLQADSFAYLPDETGELDSLGALFDPRFRGFVALEDNYTTAGQKTALYLQQSGLADIDDPSNLTPGELRTVIDFLIEKKQEGQFRLLWSSFEQAVQLLVSKEVHVMDCWEPMVIVANQQGANVRYAQPSEGYLLWAMAAYIVNNPTRSEEQLEATYQMLDFMLGPWYGATITDMRGYMTNPLAADFARESDAFDQATAERVAAIDEEVKEKFEFGGTWQNRWPDEVDLYEEEWQRFKSA
ncbi:extracellular solute-binding protein [Spiribacter sp. 2438]|uniref:ABC transporter substrate-binding protein n=1 Tax=Spiribacter sp. 2438 TaxID=2666185 RepID=UPI0012B05FD9|nr:substrate-binding domain-containing protein [Spiribacter sp. 2438]QGM22548.1 extracellular solute-binding protein [Spiribacter sp. 2438]